jgi:tripartite-type tricarboxylate transporter receptor subunit TctC
MKTVLSRRHALTSLASLASLPLGMRPAHAQDATSMEWVVPFAPGGASDMTSRLVAEPMGRSLGRPFVVVNKAGGATQIAAEYVAQAKVPMLMTADLSTLATNPALVPKLRYDADKDLLPIGMLARTPVVLIVNPDVPAGNLAEFAAWSQTQGGTNYGSSGQATGQHLAGELLRMQSGMKLNHVPYRGSGPAVQDVLGRQIASAVVDLASAQQHIASGRVKALGLATAQRLPKFPQLPTFVEQGLRQYEVYVWQAVAVSPATPADLRARIADALSAALDSPAVKERYDTVGLFAMPASPPQVLAYVRSERARWSEVIKANNIRLE